MIAVPLALAIPALAWTMLPKWSWSSAESGPMMVTVERGEFVHEVAESGDVESASNVELRCEVQAMGSAGTTILWIIPEGSYVKPGDKLVELDKSSLEDELVKQQIVCANSEAVRIQAENDLASAQIALEEYLEGTYIQDRTTIENEGLVAKENAQRARDYAQYSERLAARGFVTKLQLQADLFAVQKAEKDLKLAETKLRVLNDYTKKKTEKQLRSTIATCEAKLASAEKSHLLDMQKQKLIETQIEKCIIKAPEAGQVVYASQADSRGNNQIIIEEGATVRERQVIIRLPDPKRMQVKAKINEAKVSQVVAGMPATIRVNAFLDVEMKGTVRKVNEYPAPSGWFNSGVKEYETYVTIDDPPPGLRPGLTAEVKIRVADVKDVLQVPVQAVFEHGGQTYCVVRDGQDWRAQPIEVGQSNDKFLIIREGLEPNQQVVLNSAAYRDRVALPDLPSTPEAPPGSPSAQTVAQTTAKPAAGAQAKSNGAAPAAASSQQSDQVFQALDKNKDGKIQASELPEALRSGFPAADRNHDGVLDRSEAQAAMRQMRSPRDGNRQRDGNRLGGDQPSGNDRPGNRS